MIIQLGDEKSHNESTIYKLSDNSSFQPITDPLNLTDERTTDEENHSRIPQDIVVTSSSSINQSLVDKPECHEFVDPFSTSDNVTPPLVIDNVFSLLDGTNYHLDENLPDLGNDLDML
jgi:hypothetical protein